MRDVAGTVVRQETLDGHSLVGEPGDRPSQEGGRARCSLIFQNLRVSEPGSIIDGDVDELRVGSCDPEDPAYPRPGNVPAT